MPRAIVLRTRAWPGYGAQLVCVARRPTLRAPVAIAVTFSTNEGPLASIAPASTADPSSPRSITRLSRSVLPHASSAPSPPAPPELKPPLSWSMITRSAVALTSCSPRKPRVAIVRSRTGPPPTVTVPVPMIRGCAPGAATSDPLFSVAEDASASRL